MNDVTEGRYVRFEPKHDNVEEVISAEHINLLQETTERTQQGIFKAADRDFLDKALFILEHHRVANGMWLDLFENTSKIDLQRTKNLVFSETEQGVVFDNKHNDTEGWLYSKPYVNANGSNMKKVMIIASRYMPTGTNITVEISNNNADWYEVSLSDSELFDIPTEGIYLHLRAKFARTSSALTSPRLDAWCILFYDPKNEVIIMPDGSEITIIQPPGNDNGNNEVIKMMHSQLMGIGPDDHHEQEHSHDGKDGSGLIKHSSLIEVGPDDHHPKAHYHGEDGVPYVRLDQDVVGSLPYENLSYQVWTGKPGTTGLYFDTRQDDKLTYVKTPDDETYLFYDKKLGNLSHTINIVQGIAAWEEMIYSEFVNSKGETVTVLGNTEKKHYDASDEIITREIEKVTAPTAPTGVAITNPGTGNDLNISWVPNTESDMLGYNLYRLDAGNVTKTLVNTTGIITNTGYAISGLTSGTLYTFFVTAIDNDGYESERSQTVQARPVYIDTIAPAQVVLTGISRIVAGEIELQFGQNLEPDLDEYRVYMSESNLSADFVQCDTIKKGDPRVSVMTSLTPGVTYFFYVTAVDITGNESVPSITISQIA